MEKADQNLTITTILNQTCKKCIYERSVYLTAICFINVFCVITNDVHNKKKTIFALFFSIYALACIFKAILLYIKIIYSIFFCFNIRLIVTV